MQRITEEVNVNILFHFYFTLMASGTWRYLLGKNSKLVLTLSLKEIMLGLKNGEYKATKILNCIFFIKYPSLILYYLRSYILRSHILSIKKLQRHILITVFLTDGRNPIALCRPSSKKVPRPGKNPSDGATFSGTHLQVLLVDITMNRSSTGL